MILVAMLGCSRPASTPSQAPNGLDGEHGAVAAIATVGMVADLVRNVGGEHVQVTQIMGAGVDPHLYKATRDDVQIIMQGDMIFYSGLMLEGKMADTLIKVARSKPVIAITEEIDQEQLLEPEEMEGHYDPHVWMDVAAWSRCLDVIAEALADFDPTHAEAYRANAAAYKQQLDSLHQYAAEASVPYQRRLGFW